MLGVLFAGPPLGLGMLTAGFILAMMVLPFIASVTRDVFVTVPAVLRESAYGIGATTSEVVRDIVLPYTRVGIIGGVMLGLGRALGETMAVTFVIGNAHRIQASLLAPGTTISATLANEFTEAVGDLYTSSLIELGPHPLRHHLHRAGRGEADADAASRSARRNDRLCPPPRHQRRHPDAVARRHGLRARHPLPHPVVAAQERRARLERRRSSPRPRRRRAAAAGLLNAIYGSVVMTACATLVGTPIGILAGTFLAEYGRGSRLAPVVRFINDILLSAPSIVIGLFVYQVMVVPMGHFSAWAGGVALAIIVIPVVVRTTEDMLTLVPAGLREAAIALGAPQWKVVVKVIYRAALQGMLTGVMLAIARIAGETAPLLFTALNNQFWSSNMNAPMANLPVVIFQFALSPYADWQVLAWGGALLITFTILVLNIIARLLASWSSFSR